MKHEKIYFSTFGGGENEEIAFNGTSTRLNFSVPSCHGLWSLEIKQNWVGGFLI